MCIRDRGITKRADAALYGLPPNWRTRDLVRVECVPRPESIPADQAAAGVARGRAARDDSAPYTSSRALLHLLHLPLHAASPHRDVLSGTHPPHCEALVPPARQCRTTPGLPHPVACTC